MKEAEITNVDIRRVNSIWKRKPKGLGFEDTDALIVKAKSDKPVAETFYICLKPDGTFEPKAINKNSQAFRSRLVRFLKYYRLADQIKGYNLREGVKKWVGKKVKVESVENRDYIYIP